jgi:3-phytase
VRVSKAKAALVGLALVTILVMVVLAGRAQDFVSGALSTGPSTSRPGEVPASSARPPGPTTPSPAKARASGAPSSASTMNSLPRLKATEVPSGVVNVRPRLENVGFSGSGDISDDAAIWVDSDDPERSVVIADNKADAGGGIGVFGMNGKLIQFRGEGRIGNVDLRTGFPSVKGSVVLVGANNRSTNTLGLWTLSTKTRHLSSVNARSIKTMASNYGFCLYHSKTSGRFYAFVTPEEKGSIQQFELLAGASGLIDGKLVRKLPIGGKAEGCVADDENGKLYVGEENVAIWKYGAEPSSGSARVAVDREGGGHLVGDIEGMSIAYGAEGSGYLIVSSQGDSTIAIYGRDGGNSFIKRVRIIAAGTIDAVTGTDGLDVTTQNAGPGFTKGLLVVHDESNTNGRTSNLKYVSLSAVLDAS